MTADSVELHSPSAPTKQSGLGSPRAERGEGAIAPSRKRQASTGTLLRAATCAAFAGAVLFASRVDAQANLVMTSDRTEVRVAEPFNLQIRVDFNGAPGGQLRLPDFRGLELLGQNQTQMNINGAQSLVYQFVLRATRPGRVEISPARIVVGTREYRSNPLVVVAGPGAASAPTAPSVPGTTPPVVDPTQTDPAQATGNVGPAREPPTGRLEHARFDRDCFIQTVVEPDNAVVGQQVTITHYLYIHGMLQIDPQVTREPLYDGFWTVNLLEGGRMPHPSMRSIQGNDYRVYMFRRVAAFALRAGELSVSPMIVTIPAVVSPFDIFDPRGGTPEITRTSEELHIAVRPAGDGHDDVYVGEMTLQAELDRNQVLTGDGVTLRLSATGTGNIGALDIPTPTVEGLRFLQPQTHAETSRENDIVRGVKRWEWLVIAESAGVHAIAPFMVRHLDIRNGRVAEARSNALSLEATGAATQAPSAPENAQQEPANESTTEATNLPPIRNTSSLVRRRAALDASIGYWIALAAFPLLLLVIVFAKRVAQGRENLANTPSHAASVAVQTNLKEAEQCISRGAAREAYGSLSLALKKQIEVRLSEQVGGLTYPKLRTKLVERGMVNEFATRLCDALEAHEFARYSSGAAQPQELANASQNTRALIQELNRFSPKEDA